MKLKNIADGIRQLRDNGQVIEVNSGEIIEVERPSYNPNVFEKIEMKNESKTLDVVKKEELNKKGSK